MGLPAVLADAANNVRGRRLARTAWLWPDVSNVQGHPIDAALAKRQGMSAIAAKATQGTWFADDLCAANHTAATSVGLPFMAYHFLEPGNGAAQAHWFATHVQAACGTLDVALLLDWERLPDGRYPTGADADTFLHELDQLAPHAPKSVYTAAWVTAIAGPSTRAAQLPLIWPYYVPGAGNVNTLLGAVTPHWFPTPFAGWAGYAARQFTDAANIGGFPACDVNVCFDQATFHQLFTPAPTPAPKPRPKPPVPVPTPPPAPNPHPEAPMFIARVGTQAERWFVAGNTRLLIQDEPSLAVYRNVLAKAGWDSTDQAITQPQLDAIPDVTRPQPEPAPAKAAGKTKKASAK